MYPTLIEAIVLTDAARLDFKYDPPYGATRMASEGFRGSVPKSLVLESIEDRVQEMNRRKADFVLIWHWRDEGSVHVDTSPNYSECKYVDLVADYLTEELRDYLSTW